MSSATGRATLAGALGLVVWTGCADKAPEPKWPEPPPPTLAEPLGQEPEPAADASAEAKAPTRPEQPSDATTEGGDANPPAAEPNEPEDGAVRIDR